MKALLPPHYHYPFIAKQFEVCHLVLYLMQRAFIQSTKLKVRPRKDDYLGKNTSELFITLLLRRVRVC